MSKYTPKPWMAEGLSDEHSFPTVVIKGSRLTVFSDTPEEADANANLIAASPDLLEALIDTDTALISFVKYLCGNGSQPDPSNIAFIIAQNHNAIAKATK